MQSEQTDFEQDIATDCWAEKTLLFRRWEEMKQEILLHKWYESEKKGHDIGWEHAVVDWMVRHGNRSPIAKT